MLFDEYSLLFEHVELVYLVSCRCTTDRLSPSKNPQFASAVVQAVVMVMFCWFWLPPSAKETLFGITNETRPHGGLKTFFGPLKILVCVRIGPKNSSVTLQLERALAGLLLVLIYLTSCLWLLYPLSIHPSSAAYPEAQTSLFQDHSIQLFQDPKALSGQPGGKELC